MAEAQHARVQKKMDWGGGRVTNYPGFNTESPASWKCLSWAPRQTMIVGHPKQEMQGQNEAWTQTEEQI